MWSFHVVVVVVLLIKPVALFITVEGKVRVVEVEEACMYSREPIE